MRGVESFKIRIFITVEARQLTQYNITPQTLTDLRSSYVPEGPSDASRSPVHVSTLRPTYVYVKGSPIKT